MPNKNHAAKLLFFSGLFLLNSNLANAFTPNDFVTTWSTENDGITAQITVPTIGVNPYNIDCNDDGVLEGAGVIGDFTCDYSAGGLGSGPGTYTVVINGNFENLNCNANPVCQDLVILNQWGSIN